MARIKSVGIVSAANLFSAVYGAFGIWYVVQFGLIYKTDPLYAPLGLLLPKFGIKLDLHIGLHPLVVPLLLAPIAYVATGWISGAFCAAAYNLLARAGVGLKVKMESRTQAAPEDAQELKSQTGTPSWHF